MHPILVEIGPLTLYSYGFMLALGVALATAVTVILACRAGIAEESVLDIVIIGVLAGVIGSRLFYVFLYDWSYYREHLWQILNIRNEGLVFYGGLIAGTLAVCVYLYFKRLSIPVLADIIAPGIALAYGVGRIGCFLNGCCYGKPTDAAWGIVFPFVDQISRHPTQIYETLLSFLLFGFLWWFYPRRRFDGQVFLGYLGFYAILRFAVEFLRENLMVSAFLTVAQINALIMLGLTLVAYIWLSGRKDLKHHE